MPLPDSYSHLGAVQEVERQYKEGTVKAAMVAVLKAAQPQALTVQGELAWPWHLLRTALPPLCRARCRLLLAHLI